MHHPHHNEPVLLSYVHHAPALERVILPQMAVPSIQLLPEIVQTKCTLFLPRAEHGSVLDNLEGISNRVAAVPISHDEKCVVEVLAIRQLHFPVE